MQLPQPEPTDLWLVDLIRREAELNDEVKQLAETLAELATKVDGIFGKDDDSANGSSSEPGAGAPEAAF